VAVPALAGLERPLIVFWGVLDRRMDVSFIQRLAAELTAGTIVLAGPHADPDPALFKAARVVAIGSLPFEQLPHLAREASVLIMPYADLPVTRAIQPLKLKEYLATGRPVVVRDLPATRDWSDCLDVVDTAVSFSEVVRRRLAEGVPEPQILARARLSAESWTEKARMFEQWALSPDLPTDVTHEA
jgi:glycosyltransferase involved in cell wall biosynthesis